MSERELNKVRLESISSASEDEEEAPATASAGLDFPEGYESAVSDEGEVEVDYAVGELWAWNILLITRSYTVRCHQVCCV